MNKTTEALKLAEEALNAMLTHMGMDEDEWTKPTFDQSRKTLAAIREALAEQDKQEPTSNKYNHKRIGWELERTAMGDSYYGNALYSAMDFYFLNKREKDCLHRYMHGSETPNDRFVLQDIANKVYFEPEAEQVQPVKQEPVYAFRRRGLDDFCTCTKERYEELVDKPNLFEVTTFYASPVSVEAAVLAEREACANVCEEVNTANKGFPLNAKTYAAAIRARGEK